MESETIDSLRVHVRRGLDRFCLGQYFTEYGLQENAKLIPDDVNTDDLEASGLMDKKCAFQVFLKAVASEIVKEKGVTKGRKKRIKDYLEILQAFSSEWVDYIRKNMRKKKQSSAHKHSMGSPDHHPGGGGADPLSSPIKKKGGKRGPRGPYKKRKHSAAAAAAAAAAASSGSSPGGMAGSAGGAGGGAGGSSGDYTSNKRQRTLNQQHQQQSRQKPKAPVDIETARREFEAERDEVMTKVPTKNKKLFNQVGFAKWGKTNLPAMVLDPFSVPPGDIRDQWRKMFDNVVEKDRISKMGHLVWWIGPQTDGQSSYSVVPNHGFMTYEEGAARNMHELPAKIKKALDRGSELNKTQMETVEALRILNELALQSKEEREHPRSDFVEEDYWGIDDDEEEEEEEEEEEQLVDDEKEEVVMDDEDDEEEEEEEEELLDDDEDLMDSSLEESTKKSSKKKKGKKRKKDQIIVEDEDHTEIVYDDIEEAYPIKAAAAAGGPPKKKKKKDKTKKKKKKASMDGAGGETAGGEGGDDSEDHLQQQQQQSTSATASAGLDDFAAIPRKPKPAATTSSSDVAAATGAGAAAVRAPTPDIDDPSDSADSALVDSDYGGDEFGEGGGSDEQLLDDDDPATSSGAGKKKNKKTKKGSRKNKDKSLKEEKEEKKGKKKKSKDKKAGKEPKKKSKAAEQRDLEMCEEEYLPLILKLQMAKDKKDIAAIQGVLEDLLPVAESFTASFFSEYGIPETMKQTKTVLAGAGGDNDLSTYRKLWNRMKQSYAEKFQQLPEGFKAKKRKSSKALAPVKQESSEDEPSEKAAVASASIIVKKEEITPQGSPVRSSEVGAGPDSTTDPNDKAGDTSPLKLPVKEGKRRVSLGNEQQQQAKKTVEKPPAPKPKEKFSILKLLPKKKDSTKRLSVSGGTEKSSATPSSVPNKKTVPSWVTAPVSEKYDSFNGSDGREDRMFALEFLLQAAAHFPPNKGVNEESVARSLEGAIFEWSQGQIAQVQRGRTKWEDVYWDKVHAIVAAITGKRDVGTLVEMVMEGSFVSPASLIKLSVEVLEHSFEGRPIVLNE